MGAAQFQGRGYHRVLSGLSGVNGSDVISSIYPHKGEGGLFMLTGGNLHSFKECCTEVFMFKHNCICYIALGFVMLINIIHKYYFREYASKQHLKLHGPRSQRVFFIVQKGHMMCI